MSEYKEEYLPDMLPLYYNRLFPYESFYNWLSYGSSQYFENRELSFTLLDDIYLRFQSFDNLHIFTQELEKLKPVKIDIGAVYNCKPRDSRYTRTFTAQEKEMVVDIDLTDYDDTRTCCSNTDVCHKCWKFMTVACKILDTIFQEDFGFKHMLWVFSGRRGIHCWICDEEVRKFNDEQRGAVADYINIFKGGQQAKRVQLYSISSSTQNTLNLLLPYFREILIEQDFLGSNEQLNNFLSIINVEIRQDFREAISAFKTSEERWDAFINHHKQLLFKSQLPKNCKNLVEEIMLQYCYPRLDVNVTKGTNHLLKAPFCVHPKTGKISIPLNAKVVEKFDPSTVPTLNLLVDEINAYDKISMEQEVVSQENETNPNQTKGEIILKRIKDYKKTSLLKPVTTFNNFIKSMEYQKIKGGQNQFGNTPSKKMRI